MKELICIVCPKGCRLQVDEEKDYSVTGNSCPRGAEYGRIELTHPTRVVTSTVRCVGGTHPRCPVKTDRAVPKELVFRVMEELDGLTVTAPVQVGQVLQEHVCGTEANVVATRSVIETQP
jgi:CxxC motif-containing protein